MVERNQFIVDDPPSQREIPRPLGENHIVREIFVLLVAGALVGGLVFARHATLLKSLNWSKDYFSGGGIGITLKKVLGIASSIGIGSALIQKVRGKDKAAKTGALVGAAAVGVLVAGKLLLSMGGVGALAAVSATGIGVGTVVFDYSKGKPLDRRLVMRAITNAVIGTAALAALSLLAFDLRELSHVVYNAIAQPGTDSMIFWAGTLISVTGTAGMMIADGIIDKTVDPKKIAILFVSWAIAPSLISLGTSWSAVGFATALAGVGIARIALKSQKELGDDLTGEFYAIARHHNARDTTAQLLVELQNEIRRVSRLNRKDLENDLRCAGRLNFTHLRGLDDDKQKRFLSYYLGAKEVLCMAGQQVESAYAKWSKKRAMKNFRFAQLRVVWLQHVLKSPDDGRTFEELLAEPLADIRGTTVRDYVMHGPLGVEKWNLEQLKDRI